MAQGWSYVGIEHFSLPGNNNQSYSIDIPEGTQEGDTLIALLNIKDASSYPTGVTPEEGSWTTAWTHTDYHAGSWYFKFSLAYITYYSGMGDSTSFYGAGYGSNHNGIHVTLMSFRDIASYDIYNDNVSDTTMPVLNGVAKDDSLEITWSFNYNVDGGHSESNYWDEPGEDTHIEVLDCFGYIPTGVCYMNAPSGNLASYTRNHSYPTSLNTRFTFRPVQLGEADLQGVATLPTEGNVGIASATSEFQGVGSMTTEGMYIAGGESTLQGIARILEATPEGVPSLDFTRYDLYIEGQGETWGLMSYKDEGAIPATQSVNLQPTRTDVGNNPMEMRPETGDYYSQGDFVHGAGQLYYHRSNRDPDAYFWSEGFDVSEDGKLMHLHDVGEAYDSADATVLVQSGGLPFVAVDTKVRRGDGNWPGTWTEEDPQATGTDSIVDMISAGDVIFAALDGTGGIQKRSNAGVWSDFSSLVVTKLAYVMDRLIAVESDGTVIEINIGTGAQEGSDLDALLAGYVAEEIFEAGGFIHIVTRSSADDQARVLHFGLTDAGAIEKKASTKFPQGQQLWSGAGYLDRAYIGGGVKNTTGGYDPILYECYIDADLGLLSYTVIAEDEGSGSYTFPVQAICPQAESILFGWTLTTGSLGGVARDGIAKWDISRPAFTHHLKKAGAGTNKAITSLLVYKGRVLFTVAGDGVYYEKDTYVASASLIPSIGDWGNAGWKAWEVATMSFSPLPTGTSVELEYSEVLPEETSTWKDIIVCSTADETEVKGDLGLVSRLLALKITSTANGTQTAAPVVLAYSIKSYPTVTEDPEYRLVRFIRLLNRDRRDPQAPTVYYNPQSMREWLQSLVHGRAIVYEPGAQWAVRVEQVQDAYPEQVWYEATMGETGRDFYVVQLTMRGTR